eukprot:scaffold13.g368.t1
MGMPPPAGAGAPDMLAGISRYRMVRDLSQGSYGHVALVEDLKKQDLHSTKYVEREIINQLRLRHPHVIALREVLLTDDHLVVAMEYAPGGDLWSYVVARQRLSEEEARWFFSQLLVAVDYCHCMGVASRDIKLENTLLDGSPRPLIKLADFGFSKNANQSAAITRLGTPAYLAPEVVVNPPGQAYDARKADTWSCGVILYVMVTGMYPFQRRNDLKLGSEHAVNAGMRRITQADFMFPPEVPLSAEVKDLISRILVTDPSARPSIRGLQSHPWFEDGVLAKALLYNDRIVADTQPPSQQARAPPRPPWRHAQRKALLQCRRRAFFARAQKLEAISALVKEAFARAAEPPPGWGQHTMLVDEEEGMEEALGDFIDYDAGAGVGGGGGGECGAGPLADDAALDRAVAAALEAGADADADGRDSGGVGRVGVGDGLPRSITERMQTM